MVIFTIIAVLLGLYFSWKTWRLMKAIAMELKIQEEMGLEIKWFNIFKEALKDKVYGKNEN